MPIIFGGHKVKDYATWRPYFDGDEERRQSYGIKTLKVLQHTDDPNHVFMMMEVQDMNKLQQLFEDPAMGPIMEQAGALEKPDFTVFNEV